MFEQVLKLCKGVEVQITKPLTLSKCHTFIGELRTDHDGHGFGDWWIYDNGITVGFRAAEVEKVTIEPKSSSQPNEMWVTINLKYKRE